ncbi:deiodinase family protein [Rosistilla oblonga]|uniref:Iodothyronine deiodinase n=1 Tax=Rosistilla oblonga TaxID=2527990 RepID=A0A518IPA3_9BACT|nr:deiodinase family protein [Rosistilla oblonga]QDV54907.1 Iodothyronine deiodinase [Rosistilla oblonga]
MFNKISFVTLGLLALPISVARCDEPSSDQATIGDQLTPEATAIESELRNTLLPDSEAIAMLDAIVNGSTLSGDDGWFPLAKADGRPEWNKVVKKYDTDADQEITLEEFKGTEADFSRLDRSGDKRLSQSDFDWTEHSLAPLPGQMMFFLADRDANGKVTRDEFAHLFDAFADGDTDYIALDDLRTQFLPPPPGARRQRADRPTPSTLIASLKKQEIGSLNAGPSVGDIAPDFTLKSLAGESVTLSKQIGEKPIVLIFGNFTCGPFRSQAGNIEKLYQRYNQRAKFFLVYVREAHPKDGWWMLSNQRAGIDIAQPNEIGSRRIIAQQCQSHLNLDMPFLVDEIDDTVGSSYSGMPNRLYLIDQQGAVAFKSGRGPFGFHPRQLEQALILLLNEEHHAVK